MVSGFPLSEFEWCSRIFKPLEKFLGLMNLDRFEASTMMKWMFGGVIEKGYMDMGVQGQVFYMAYTCDALILQLETLYETLSIFQREQVESSLNRWKMDVLELMERKASSPSLQDEKMRGFEVDIKIHKLPWREITSPIEHDSFIDCSRVASKKFYNGIKEREWGKILEAVKLALGGFVEAGVRSSWLRYNLYIAFLKAFELKVDDLIDNRQEILNRYGGTALDSLFKIAPRYGFKPDWVAATIYGYPSIYSTLEVVRDEWTSIREGPIPEGEESYVREVSLRDCATLIYAREAANLTRRDVEALEDWMCTSCAAFWKEAVEHTTPEGLDSKIEFERTNKTDCLLKMRLTIRPSK